MSIIEKAANKLVHTEPVLGQSDTAIPTMEKTANRIEGAMQRERSHAGATSEQPAVAARSDSDTAATSSMLVEVDLKRLAHMGCVTPDAERSQIAEEFRLIKQLEDQKLQEAKTAKTTGGGRSQNPVYQQLTIAIAEADATAASLASRVNDFQGRYNALKSTVDSTPEVEAEYTQLTRDYEVYKQNYAAMLERRETANLSGEVESKTDVVDFRVIDPPRVPLQPSWPNRPLLISLAPLVGILAGIAVAFLVSQLRRTVTDRRVLRELTGLPLLGSVTRIETDAVKIKKRKGLIAYGLSILSLIGAYGILLGLQMFMAR